MKKGTLFAKTSSPLHELRIRNGLTVTDVAELMDMSAAQVSKMFNGKMKITPLHKEKLMNIFDLGYGQISDICNRMNTLYYNGDLRTRNNVETTKNEEPVVESVVEPVVGCTSSEISDIQYTNPISGEHIHEKMDMHNAIPDVKPAESVITINTTVTSDKSEIADTILDLVYGKVSRSDYAKLSELLLQW
jgi:transcriptional regulator with XRE-family HTH domain